MIDAKAFGEELAVIVRAQTAPLIQRIADLEKSMAEAPPPEKGDPGENGIDGKDGTDGAPGESVTIDDVLPDLQKQVRDFLDAVPVPENGIDGKDGTDGAPGEKGSDGKDGVGLAGAFIDRAGELTVTLTNGETRALGVIVGKDGAPGTDGVGFDDMDITHDGERSFTFRFQRGSKIVERSFTLPVLLDRGVFSEGEKYAQGDAVSFGGSMWVAQKETDERPGSGDGWRLAVKKGRDGKDGELKEPATPKPVRVG